ncbi:electron transport complex subunit RsxG [Bibersteinia trehalosi]|nr:electron transport complex subunit RsxG [Bibersteinia trehalosi]
MMTRQITLRYALILGAVALACTLISTLIFGLTKGRIEQVTAEQQRILFREILPQELFDNDPTATCKMVNEPEQAMINKIYFAKKGTETTAYILQTTAPDGYSGNIVLLMAIEPNGNVLGVRTLEHKETPGLGDKIETRVSDWIKSFSNRIFRLENESEWAVKKDGGSFDQFTGATITPRAVVNNVRQSAKWTINELAKNPQMVEQFKDCK